MKKRLKTVIIIILASILLFIGLMIILLSLQNPQAGKQQISPTFFPTPTSELNISEFPENTTLPIKYDKAAEDRLVEKMQNRETLSSKDTDARDKILSMLQNEDSGVVYRSKNIIIEYVTGPDLFQVEILTTDVEQAKLEASIWFAAQGMSENGMCNLPIMFYINSEIREKFRESTKEGYVFSPLPKGC